MRMLLLPFSLVYGLIVGLRTFFYDKGWLKSTSFPIPIIVVGNLSVGGTGKSPMTLYLAHLLKDQKRVAVLSRGYGRKTKGYRLVNKLDNARDVGDEPLQYAQVLQDVIVAVAEKRVEGIQQLMKLNPVPEVILLDDAFQHRAVKGGFNILLTEFSKPYSRDFLLPAGMLRESRSGAKRAQAIVVTKCPMALSYETRSTFQLELNVNNNQKTYFSYIHYREQLSLVNGGAIPISTLRTSGVLLFTGIANPTPLIDFLKGAAAELSVVQFADHHPYSVDDLQTVKNKFDKFAVNNEKAFIITTRKDWMRIQSDDRFTFTQNWTLAVIDIDTDFFDQDKTDFNHIILNYVHQKHSGIS